MWTGMTLATTKSATRHNRAAAALCDLASLLSLERGVLGRVL